MIATATQKPLSAADARRIAESVVGPADWFDDAQGWCQCPGEASHTKTTAHDACKVVCERVVLSDGILTPGVYCHHESCAIAVDSASKSVRSLLGKAQPSDTPRANWTPPKPKPRPSTFELAQLERVASKVPSVSYDWLADRSRKAVHNRTPASFLHELYRDGEKVVVFDDYESQGQAVWTRRPSPYDASELDEFTTGKPDGVWFLCNPVSGETVLSDRKLKDGRQKPSRRCWQAVTAWRYLVLESDNAPSDLWLRALVQIPLPIAAIYTSGGKSIHALIKLDAESKQDWNRIAGHLKPWLVVLGADRKAISAVRLTRLPGCERASKGSLQQLLYLNGAPECAPIAGKS